MKSLIFAAELLALVAVLFLAIAYDISAALWISLALLAISAFTLITGIGAWRISNRGRALGVICVAVFFLLTVTNVHKVQTDAELESLRQTDTDAYLERLSRVDEERWLEELRAMRPKAYDAEMKRRTAEVAAERRRKCNDGKLSEAYVMIQADVKRRLKAPATAEFPTRYGKGSRNENDCVYRVVGHVDAQNAFGAVLRNQFRGRIEYFPGDGSWRTLELSVGD